MPFGIIFINTATTGIRERFGRFVNLAKPGFNIYIPFIEKITPVCNRLKQDNFKFEVKTKDNVFTRLNIAVQYKIEDQNSESAFYSLQNPKQQINSYIENVVRAQVPKMNLDDLFESQDTISQSVSNRLAKNMKRYGYTIESTLVKEIEPNSEVKEAMNRINASERLKHAMKNEADAYYIKNIRQAEADRDRKKLQGEGISLQRLAIMNGYQESVENMSKSFGLSPKDIVDFVIKTQHLDTMEIIGKSQNAKTIFYSHDPDNFNLRNKLIEAKETD